MAAEADIPENGQLSPANRAAFSDAMQAWFSGEFERCLGVCDAVVARDAFTRTQVRLLRARALLRLGRADEALEELRDKASLHPTPDIAATALLLTAAAHVRLGNYARGLALLDDARAVPGEIHTTIRSEIALTAGLAFYGMRSLDQAERRLGQVAPDSDIVYARSLEYRGWIASVRGDDTAAARHFEAALAQLDAAGHHDRYLEANALMALGIIASERFDSATWRRVVERAQRFDWSAPGLTRPRYCLALFSSVFTEADGDPRGAMRSAVEAELTAANDAQRAQAVLRRAEIARGSGDATAHVTFVDQADLLLRRMPRDDLEGDALYVPLTVAEEFALAGDRRKAEEALALYRAIERPMGMLAVSSDVRRQGFERMAEAHVLAAKGEEPAALRAFLDAFEIFERVGYRRRAAIAALRLTEMTRSERYRLYALDATEGLAPTFWLRRRALARDRVTVDHKVAQLTELERETLVLACRGLTNEEIAAAQGRSFYTVRNMMSDLYEFLGIKGRRQLSAVFVRLGIVDDPGRPSH
jgi:DNA-binding CsgD family transcriptional regulator